MRVGIFFGGPSREREISFAGGRTVYDNLNKELFEPVPIFVDSQKRFILLDWQYIYKGSIRDFYPPVAHRPKTPIDFQIYIESLLFENDEASTEIIEDIGKQIFPHTFSQYFDFAFLSLHGQFGEDGIIQGLLETYDIPYSGSGIRSSSIGMDKSIQKDLMAKGGFHCPTIEVITKKDWDQSDTFYNKVQQTIGFPLVIRPANQGSSIGVSILKEDLGPDYFNQHIDKAFFVHHISASQWKEQSQEARIRAIQEISDIRSGVGLPLTINNVHTIYHPYELLSFINEAAAKGQNVQLEGHATEQKVMVESFIHGKEFSCIVIRKEDGTTCALPPTEIVKYDDLYDYRSKYLPGLSRKITPIELPNTKIDEIRQACETLFAFLDFQVYARIDGFYGDDGNIYLNDPNTTSGMLPSSFFFHQAAEIGLNPSEFLTYIVRMSLMERIQTTMHINASSRSMLKKLDNSIQSLKGNRAARKRVGIILGGYSFERHISVESGRNIFEKLSSSEKYDAIPLFLMQEDNEDVLYQIPIALLLKDNADDIAEKIKQFKVHPITASIKELNSDIIKKYVDDNTVFAPRKIEFTELSNHIDLAFIALHGRPGEDGSLQLKLKAEQIPYNGSDWESSHVTIDKFNTLQTLKQHGFTVADQFLIKRDSFTTNKNNTVEAIEKQFKYPLIAKPVDDGCSSAVKKINNRDTLIDYLSTIFRGTTPLTIEQRNKLNLAKNEEFPSKNIVLIESLVEQGEAEHFMEITGGLLTHLRDGEIVYEMFEPSETLSTGDILTLEEKFLAGEGQNITPARFADSVEDYVYIANQVKSDLERAARILKVKGYARIDAFVRIFKDKTVETIIIEVNSLPGMTPATCIFHQCALYDYKPYQFIDKILEFAIDDKQNK